MVIHQDSVERERNGGIVWCLKFQQSERVVPRHLGGDTRIHTLDDIKTVKLNVKEREQSLSGSIGWQVVREQTLGLARVGSFESRAFRLFTAGLLVHESLETTGVHRLLSRCSRKREHSCIYQLV